MSPLPAVVSALAGSTGGTYPHHQMMQRWGISSLVFDAQSTEAIKAAHAALAPRKTPKACVLALNGKVINVWWHAATLLVYFIFSFIT